MRAYFESVDRPTRVAAAFDDAEFALCGSFPLRIEVEDDEDADVELDAPRPPIEVLSALGRWDFHIEDAAALISAGRQARRELAPDESHDDRNEAVSLPYQAAYEIAHARGWDALVDAPGLKLMVDCTSMIPQSDYQGMGRHPFAIADLDH